MAQVRALLFLSILLPISQHFLPTHATLAADDLSPDLSPSRVHHGKSSVTPTMAIILACLISTFLLTCFFSIYVHRCVHRQMMTLFSGPASLQATTRGVDPSVVASFPTFVYSEVKELKIGECALECAVCLNEFEDEETLQLLPKCWHVFHPDCIQSWLSSHVTCPVCRADLLSELGQTSHQVPVLSQASVLDPDVPTVDNDEIVVHVQSPDEITVVDSLPKSLPPRSTSRKERRFKLTFRKSLSTGHSLVLPVTNCERFTLRLPDEVRNRLVNSGLKRARSCHVAFPRARSGRKGFRSTSNGGGYERFDRDGRAHRWVFTATPPFFSRAGPSRPILAHDSGSEAGTTPVGLLKSVTSPFNRLFRSPNFRKDDVADEERFTDVLVSDGKV